MFDSLRVFAWKLHRVIYICDEKRQRTIEHGLIFNAYFKIHQFFKNRKMHVWAKYMLSSKLYNKKLKVKIKYDTIIAMKYHSIFYTFREYYRNYTNSISY